VLRAPELDAGLQVGTQQSRVEGQKVLQGLLLGQVLFCIFICDSESNVQ